MSIGETSLITPIDNLHTAVESSESARITDVYRRQARAPLRIERRRFYVSNAKHTNQYV
jgi:hypothetical protein